MKSLYVTTFTVFVSLTVAQNHKDAKHVSVDNARKIASVASSQIGKKVAEKEWIVDSVKDRQMYILLTKQYDVTVLYSGKLMSISNRKLALERSISPQSGSAYAKDADWIKQGKKIVNTVFPGVKVSFHEIFPGHFQSLETKANTGATLYP